MPCYLLTFHAYGSWMPDRRQGFVIRHRGIQPRNAVMAEAYRQRANFDAVTLTDEQQHDLIECILEAAAHQQLRVHFVATEPTHLHMLVSWTKQAGWAKVRSGVGQSMTRMLNQTRGEQTWFAKSPSRKQVRDREHFDHLTTTYLPRHRGWKWSEKRGLHK
ncbi:MAG: hypothetical protein ACYC26_06700 [Phycisphaerales bacterium]